MKFNLLALALLGHIDAETLHHRTHKKDTDGTVDKADEPLYTPDLSGKSRLVNQTKLEMDEMYVKPKKWSTLNYGPYEAPEGKKLWWDKKTGKLMQL